MKLNDTVKVIDNKSSNYNHVGVIKDIVRIHKTKYYVEFGEYSDGLYTEEQLKLLPDNYVLESLKNELPKLNISKERCKEILIVLQLVYDSAKEPMAKDVIFDTMLIVSEYMRKL